jgi:DNA repair exonuclease SbcCD nuclease subunit
MKIALLNDTHFGCRNDNPAFIKFQNKFYDEQFFPFLQRNDIKCLIHLGDVVDRRKFINHNTAHNFKKVFWNRLDDMDIETHVIIGNHDTYYKNTNEVNALQNLNISKNTSVYTHATDVEFDGLKILFIPWICDENHAETIRTIGNSTATIAMGHLEISGFEMHNGHMNEQGLEKAMFKRFEKVMSGHFHKKSDDGQIYYLGTQYEMTWSDYMCPKGFHIFDTETRELLRVPNPLRIHRKIIYDDTKENYTLKKIEDFKDCFIKLYISKKTDNDMYNNFLNRLHTEINIHELNIIEDTFDIQASVPENILDQGEDTLTFLGNYIDSVDTELDKQKLKTFAEGLYTEANEQ